MRSWIISQNILSPLRRGGRRCKLGKMSKEKGKRGERELANKLKEYGYNCRRGQQFCGANGDADVVGLPGIHLEVKRTERLSIYDAMDQAKRDKKPEEIPVVMHRRNHCEWLAIMRLEDFISLYREMEAGLGLYKTQQEDS